MKTNRSFWIILGLNILLVVFVFTPISLTGYWTDILFAIGVGLWTIASVSKFQKAKEVFLIVIAIVHGFSTLFYGFLLLLVISGSTPKGVPSETVQEGPLRTHSYFRPVGLAGCGYGSYWQTQSFTYFPIFEWETYKDPCIDDDFGYYIANEKWE